MAAAVPQADQNTALVEVQLADDGCGDSAGLTVEVGRVQVHLARDFDAQALQRAVAALADAGH